MPTGYTAAVQDGTITSFRDFALLCARAMGANVMMRDEPMDVPIREYEPSSWYKDKLEEAKAALYDAERLSSDEAAKLLAAERERMAQRLTEVTETTRLHRERYEKILVQAREWTPPTNDHKEMKAFMISQLEESIRGDCHDYSLYYVVKASTSAEYKAELVAKAQYDIEYYTREWAKEQERTRERNAWNKALIESLGFTGRI